MSDFDPILGKWVCHLTDLEQEAPGFVTFVGQYLDGSREYTVKQSCADGIRVITMPAVEWVEVEAPTEPHISGVT